MSVASAPAQEPGDPWDRLDQLVRRLELDRFRTALLEERLLATPAEGQPALAQELAQLYLQELYRRGEQGDPAPAVQERLAGLLKQFPVLDKPALRAALLYGDFARMESQFRAAMDAPQQPELRDLARQAAQRFLQTILDSGLADSHAGEPAPDKGASILFLDELPATQTEDEGWRNQIRYLQAWASYYAGILSEASDERRNQWTQANQLFRQILQIQASTDLREIQAGWLDISSSSLARTALGLGLTEQALGRDAAAALCFGWLHSAETYPELRRHWLTWRINSFLFPDQVESLQLWLDRELASQEWLGDELSALGYAADLAHRNRTARPERASAYAAVLESLTKLLVRQNQLELIDQWIRSGMVAPESFRDDFTRRLLEGRQLFLQAEASGDRGDYEAADKRFESALKVDSGNLTPQQTAQITFLRGWCLLRTQQYDQAIVQFRLAQRLADPWDAEFAAQAAWMTIECQMRGASAGTQPAGQIEQALQRFQSRYPSSPLLAQAEFAQARWEARTSGSPESLARLEGMERSNPQWAAAQLEAARLHHAQAAAALREDRRDEFAAHRAALDRVAQRLVDDASGDPVPVAQVWLLQLDLEIGDAQSDSTSWEAKFAEIEERLKQVEAPVGVTVELQWQRFRAAQRLGDLDRAGMLAAGLAEQSTSAPIREAALLFLADRYQQAVETADSATRESALREAHTFYRQLTEVFGTDPASLARSRNAFLALQRLGDLEVALGDQASADGRFSQLVAAAPRDLAALQRSAASKQRLRQWEAATDLWRTIARGVTPGTEDWLEAKYQLIVCLRETGSPSALEVLDQTVQLMPQLSAAWRTRFAQLRDTLTTGSAR